MSNETEKRIPERAKEGGTRALENTGLVLGAD